MDIKQFESSEFKGKIQESVKAAETIRAHKDRPKDISFGDIIKEKFNVTLDGLMTSLGIDPYTDTVQNIVSVPDVDVRWIIPEVFRTALLLGYRGAPIYPNIIASEEQMRGLTQIMPHVNMSEATPHYIGEGETIPLGTVSYGSKQFRIFKVGRGIKLTDEVVNYASLNLVSIFMKDFGVKMGHAADVLAIDCLLNGEQVDGSESAPVVGVDTAGSLTYKDLLTIWVRLGRMGRVPNTMIGGEAIAIDTLNLTEFKTPVVGTPRETLNLKTPVPQTTNYFVHGNVPSNQSIIIDPTAALIKFNGWPLKVESERIVSNQTEAFYVTLQTGFAKLFTDACIVVDRSVLRTAAPLPASMNIDLLQNVQVK